MQESKLLDFKQWLHETKQHLEEAKWREKSLSEDAAAAARREDDLQKSVAEMDATIMGLEEVCVVCMLFSRLFCVCTWCLHPPLFEKSLSRQGRVHV